MKRIALALILLLGTSALAQVPPGKWWRRPDVIQRLDLTEDQQTKIEQIFRGAAADLIDLKAEMDKLQIQLRTELDQQQLNRAAIRDVAAKLNAARSRRFERELMMFVDMRGVLNDTQWNRMRAELETMAAENQQNPRRNTMRPRQ